MKAKIVKTEFGFEPAFWNEDSGSYVVEPGFAKSTRDEAQEALNRDLQSCRDSDFQSRIYEAQIAYACGERD
jgi:hypothetical protein